MLASISRRWWVVLLRGIFAMLFGCIAFAWPAITLTALVFVFGVYAIIDGVAAIATGFDSAKPWWQMVIVGVLSLAAGVLTFIWPGVTAVVLLLVIAIWAIARGIVEIYAAIQLRKVVEHEWLLILGGAFSILFGVILIARPGAGALAVLWIIGCCAIAFGLLTTALAFALRSLRPCLVLEVTDSKASGN